MVKLEKPWGYEEIIVQNKRYVVKLLFIKANHRLSLQAHKRKHETLFALEGCPSIWIGKGAEQPIVLTPHNFIDMPKMTVHRITSEVNRDVLLLEVSTPELNDVVRYADDYGR